MEWSDRGNGEEGFPLTIDVYDVAIPVNGLFYNSSCNCFELGSWSLKNLI
jgi:hypothetical protein